MAKELSLKRIVLVVLLLLSSRLVVIDGRECCPCRRALVNSAV